MYTNQDYSVEFTTYDTACRKSVWNLKKYTPNDRNKTPMVININSFALFFVGISLSFSTIHLTTKFIKEIFFNLCNEIVFF